jgi:hypothetical protein
MSAAPRALLFVLNFNRLSEGSSRTQRELDPTWTQTGYGLRKPPEKDASAEASSSSAFVERFRLV